MGDLNVFCRLKNNKKERFRLDDVQMDGPVTLLRSNIARRLQTEPGAIDLLYAGNRLNNDEIISTYEIKNGVTVHVVEKTVKTSNSCDSSKSFSTGSFKGIISSSHYKVVVDKLVSNAQSLEKLFSVAPELEKDHVALSVLQEQELLEVLVEQNLIDKLIAEHPGISKAFMYIGSAVAEKSADMPPQSQRLQYSIDQMSDDEDMAGPSAQDSRPQTITAGQLGAALANLASHMDGSSGSSGATTSGPQPITPEIFRQAVAAATSGTSQSEQNPVSESDLQQLREMGITDENVARRALQATGGNIQAALELIFGDGF